MSENKNSSAVFAILAILAAGLTSYYYTNNQLLYSALTSGLNETEILENSEIYMRELQYDTGNSNL